MNDETIICRCEDLTREQLSRYIAMGFRTVDEIKRVSRAGMGNCQGRTCTLLIAGELANYYHLPVEEVLQPSFRPPVSPIDIGLLEKSYWEAKENDADGRKKI